MKGLSLDAYALSAHCLYDHCIDHDIAIDHEVTIDQAHCVQARALLQEEPGLTEPPFKLMHVDLRGHAHAAAAEGSPPAFEEIVGVLIKLISKIS